MNVVAFARPRPRDVEELSSESRDPVSLSGPRAADDLDHRQAVGLTMVMRYLERAKLRNADRTADQPNAIDGNRRERR